MAGLVRSLGASQPVARFQRYCGLFPAASGAAEGGARLAQGLGNGSGHLPRTGDLRNGGAGGATCNNSSIHSGKF
uniref:Uncharacterized protein n=1 Tax=Sphaerodactylus townsendi TaxID=933632 RepID=A0ACB8FA71_9SAUR